MLSFDKGADVAGLLALPVVAGVSAQPSSLEHLVLLRLPRLLQEMLQGRMHREMTRLILLILLLLLAFRVDLGLT